MFEKDKVAAIVAEFMGTAILSLAVLTIVLRTSFPVFPALTAGLVVGGLVILFGKVSGAQFNPAITFGLWSQRKLETTRAIVYVAAQLLGGLVAIRVAERLVAPQELLNIANGGLETKVLIAEIIGTFVFSFGLVAAVYNSYEGGKAAAAIGTSLFMGILVASLASNGILNPAVAIGLSSLSWAYVLGPLLGSVLGMTTYSLLFAPTTAKTKKKIRK